MLILSVESTCDETAVAVTENGRRVLTDQIFSQADLHAVYGGVVPEIASRSHVEVISRLADRAVEAAGVGKHDLDAIAVSYAPGLIGAVLVGVNFAKSAAMALDIPLIPVHHVRGHIAANYLAFPELEPPFLCLAISGGNTMLVDVRDYTDMRVLGRCPYRQGRRLCPAPPRRGRESLRHELFRPEDGRDQSGPPRRADRGAAGRSRTGGFPVQGHKRNAGEPDHGRRRGARL